jgi:hypothetical protein
MPLRVGASIPLLTGNFRGGLDRLDLAERAHCGAATERPVPQRNGDRIRRAQDGEGSTAADELCPIVASRNRTPID